MYSKMSAAVRILLNKHSSERLVDGGKQNLFFLRAKSQTKVSGKTKNGAIAKKCYTDGIEANRVYRTKR